MIAGNHDAANEDNEREFHWHLMGGGGRVPPLLFLIPSGTTGHCEMAETGIGIRSIAPEPPDRSSSARPR